MGDTYSELGDSAKTVECYEKALEIDPVNSSALNNYAYYLAQRGQDLDRAERMAALAVKYEPENANFIDTYAWVFFAKKDYTKALLYIKDAVEKGEDEHFLEHYKPDLAAQFVNDMVRHHDTYGYLPIWDLWGQENYCMIGNHAIPVIADAILADLPGIDVEKAYRAMVESSTRPHTNSPFDLWEKLGYMPCDKQGSSVSITLEQAFDDWCVATVAERLGYNDDYQHFSPTQPHHGYQ